MASPLFEGLGLASGFGEDPIKPFAGPPKGRLDEKADLRDLLANLVGFGSKTMNDDMRSQYARLAAMYGKPTADKILNHVFVFNNRPEIQKANPAKRLSDFYAIGSRDKELQTLFNEAKTFGEGPLAGLNQSHNQGSLELSGRVPLSPFRTIPKIAQTAIKEL